MATSKDDYDRRPGTDADHGHKFELDLTCLTYLRCLKLLKINKLKTFKIANNMDHVGAFDDIVCRIEYEENGFLKTKLIFVQTKHLKEAKTQDFSDETLIPAKKHKILGKNKNYDEIKKYIKSYLQIRQIFDEEEDWFKFVFEKTEESRNKNKEGHKNLRKHFNCKLEDSLFLYYTNAVLSSMNHYVPIKDPEQVMKIFDTSSSTGIHQMKLDNVTLSSIIQKNYNFTKNEDERINQLKDQFRLYINQENENDLEGIIKDDIKSYVGKGKMDLKNFYTALRDEIKIFFREERGPFLTEEINFVEEIYSLFKLQTHATFEREKYEEWSKLFDDHTVETLYNGLMSSNFIQINSNKSKKSKTIVKIIQLADKISDMCSNVLLLYVQNKSCFKLWGNLRALRSYTDYRKVLIIVENLPVADVLQVCNTLDKEREYIVTICETKIEVEPSLWKQLSSDGLEKFLDYSEVEFQSYPTTLKEIFGNTDYQEIFENTDFQEALESLLSRFLNNKTVKLGISPPVEDQIYIEREYNKCTMLLKYEVLTKSRDIFIIYPNICTLNDLELDQCKNVFINGNEDEAKKNFSRVEASKCVHFCLAKSSGLEVLYSKGKSDDISKYKLNQAAMNERAHLQQIMSNRFTIISDDVGTGKTTSLKRMTHSIQRERKEYWTQLIDLNSQGKHLKKMNEFLNLIDFIAVTMLELNTENKMIFQHKCNTDGNVALLFDGFDEMSTEYRKQFLRLIKVLSDSKIKTFVIATRTNVAEDIKICLETFHTNFVGFSFDDMSLYFMKFWSNKDINDHENNLKKIVKEIVKNVIDNKETLNAVATVPLHTKMIAVTFNDQIQSAISQDSLPTFDLHSFSPYNIYDDFFKMHIKRCIEEKHKLSESSECYHTTEEKYNNESHIWEALACQEIFPSVTICDVTATDTDLRSIQQIGIIVNINPVKFMHRSFAEFQAAKYISIQLFKCKKIERLNFIYQQICVDDQFVVLRKFVDSIYEIEKDWETAEINYVPELVVNDKILIVAVRERNEFLFKAILRHLCENEGLLKHLLNLKRKSENYRSLLHISGFYSEQMFNDILNSEIFQRIEELDIDRRTALHIACLEGKENSVESYLKKIQYKSESSIVNKTDIYDCTPLLLAVQNESIKIIKLLLDHGASLGAKNGLGKTALMFASEKSNFETVKFLIEQGADINETDACGKTALMYAFENKKEEENIVRYLVQKGADINKRTDCGTTALMCTNETNICSDNIDTLKFLIQYGADINAIDSLGRRIYMRGNISRSIVALKYLVELGVNVANEVDAKGDTCLIQCAGAYDDIQMLEYLMEIKSYIDYQNNDGDTALMSAASQGNYENVKFLIEHGADINIFNKHGNSALIAAASQNNLLYKVQTNIRSILKLLLEHGAIINHRNKEGNSALHFVAKNYKVDVMQLLVENGADIYLKNNVGITPVMKVQENRIYNSNVL